MLAANGALLLELRSLGEFDLGKALHHLFQDPLKWALIWSILLVLVAMMTQAFERQAVLVLQGDWPTRGPIGQGRRWRVHVHEKKLERLRRNYEDVNKQIWIQVRDKIIVSGGTWTNSPYTAEERREAVRVAVMDTSPGQIPVPLREEASLVAWTDYCDAHLLASRKHLERRFNYFSVPGDVRPTRLGNFIESMYLDLADAGVSDTNFVLRNYEAIPIRLTRNHDVAISWMEMYSTTACICFGLAVTAPIILLFPEARNENAIEIHVAFLCSLAYAILGWVNYHASLRVADFLRRTLETIRQVLASSGVQL